MNKNTIDILVDFDGTVVTHEFPRVGKDVGAVPVLKELVAAGHRLILFTMRSDNEKNKYLTEAIDWFRLNDIPLYGIQTNPTQHTWTSSPKAYGQLIIDDICLGIPMIYPEDGRPYVDWGGVNDLLIERGLLECKYENGKILGKVNDKKGYNLFLDDERQPESLKVLLPTQLYNLAMDLNWTIVRNYDEFVKIIQEKGLPNIMSLDHDLGHCNDDLEYDFEEKTGMDCVKYLVNYCMDRDLDVPLYMIHSRNDVGAANMNSYLSNYKSFRRSNKKSED